MRESNRAFRTGLSRRHPTTTNAVAEVDADYRYGYDFDDIGNRRSSLERRVQGAQYVANNLNQYTSITNISTSKLSNIPTFQPVFEADGNQTLIKTATGVWQVQYNGENRPVRWESVSPGSNTLNPNTQTLLLMSFDRMGRRVTKNDQRFVYDGYLQIANDQLSSTNYQLFAWDPTELVATRPLAWNFSTSQPSTSQPLFYTHDGNKNVSEVVSSNGDLAAHYDYAAFGAVTVTYGERAAANPWRFSSEYAEDETATVYYNYRHYEPEVGRWMSRDPIEEDGGLGLYVFVRNLVLNRNDALGRRWMITRARGDLADACATKKDDTFSSLAKLLKLDRQDVDKWAHTSDGEATPAKIYRIPNLIVYQTMVRRSGEGNSGTVFSQWDRLNAALRSIYQSANFKLIYEQNVTSASSVKTLLSRDGLYRYTYTGHGSEDWGAKKGKEGGDLVTDPIRMNPNNEYEDDSETLNLDEVVVYSGRYTIYGISYMELQACNSGNLTTRKKWAKNVANAGRFVGYSGEVNNFPLGDNYYGSHEIVISGTNEQ